MNTLEFADEYCKQKYGKSFLELGSPEGSMNPLSFEQRNVVKVIAGTVKWVKEEQM